MEKKRCSFTRKTLIASLALATTLAMTMPPKAWAMLAPAQTAVQTHESNEARAADLKTIQTSLESKVIRQRLAEFKLTPEQINSRLGQLSDAQIHQTASQIRSLNPGGDAVGFVVGVLLIVVLVALCMYLFKRI
jgi:hypothetical protein